MMDKKETPTLKTWQAMVAVLVIASVLLLTGRMWWGGLGPFKNTPLYEIVDPMEEVKYISAEVHLGNFSEFGSLNAWDEGDPRAKYSSGGNGMPYYYWGGQKIQTPAPYFRYSFPPAKENEVTNKIKRNFVGILTDAAFAEGFSLPPPPPLQRKPTNPLSRADITTTIKACRQDSLVVFQVKTSVISSLRADLSKRAVFRVELSASESSVYVVEEKDALKAMKETVRSQAKSTFQFARHKYVTADARKW